MTLAEPLNLALYIHVPFCRSRCRYCDFYSEAGPSASLVHRTVDRLFHDTESWLDQNRSFRVHTLFIGGGTPTLLPPTSLYTLLSRLRSLAPDIVETTVEANPESLDEETLQALSEGGADRLSLGAQTYDEALLEWLGRPAGIDALESADRLIAEKWRGRLSRDLLAGLPRRNGCPGMTAEIRRATRDNPGHLSIYDLTVERGTPLAKAVEAGRDVLPEETVKAAEWDDLVTYLGSLGYRRYEISNFSLPGEESRHNLAYWTMDSYLGIGPGAVSTIPDGNGGARRIREAPDVGEWLSRDYRTPEGEGLTTAELVLEHFMMGLRLAAGLSRERFSRIFGLDPVALIPRTVERCERNGQLVVDSHSLRPTPPGMDILDAILVEIAVELDRKKGYPIPCWPSALS